MLGQAAKCKSINKAQYLDDNSTKSLFSFTCNSCFDLDSYKEINALKRILAAKWSNAIQCFSKVSSFLVWDMKFRTQQ